MKKILHHSNRNSPTPHSVNHAHTLINLTILHLPNPDSHLTPEGTERLTGCWTWTSTAPWPMTAGSWSRAGWVVMRANSQGWRRMWPRRCVQELLVDPLLSLRQVTLLSAGTSMSSTMIEGTAPSTVFLDWLLPVNDSSVFDLHFPLQPKVRSSCNSAMSLF